VNDMGWAKLPAAGGKEDIWNFLLPEPLQPIAALALIGAVLSVVFRIRAGIFLTATALIFGVGFKFWPADQRLWNARLLPFWLLCLFLLAGLAVAEIGRAVALLVARDPDRPPQAVLAGYAVAGLAVMLVVVALPLGIMPLQDTTRSDGSYRWLWATVSADDRNVVDDWSKWNYEGYERKPAYPEYHELVSTMADIGATKGCGRAFWEFGDERLDRYGTTMAPMLLPYWTDGCIASQEGLYFESSVSVPYHFITQGKLSAKCSCAQRFDVYGVDPSPYSGFDITVGIRQLQLLGVRYFLAFSDKVVQAAEDNPDLTPLTTTSYGWHIYEVADSSVIEPLTNEPAVVPGVDRHAGWVRLAVDWYVDPERWDVMLAADGPDEWSRVDAGQHPPTRPLPEVTVRDVVMDRDRISFDVSEVGTPVLVKVSYFPNWDVSGAEGPYRVAPNLMVVVPTSTHVELTYGRTTVDVLAYLLSALGLVLVVYLARRPPVGVASRRPAPAPEPPD
ncbi:MAG: hypothetical protein ACRD0U_04400, partial [Acidimicrobiales bacterium]